MQEAARAIIGDLPEVLTPFLTILTQNRKIIIEFLQKESIPCFLPEAAYYVFPDFSAYFNPEVPNDITFAQYLHQKFNLQIQPGEYYGAPGFARLSFAIETLKLREALNRLKIALTSLQSGN